MPRQAVSARRSEIMESVAHYLVGVSVLLKGVDKAGHFREHPFTVAFLLAAGAFIVLGAAFHRRIGRRIANFTALFHVAEGAALIAVGLMLLEKSSRLPYFFLFAGCAYLAVGLFEFLTRAEARRRLAPLFYALLGGAFLAFAAVAAVLNTLHARNGWAYATTGIIAAVGAGLLILRRRFTKPGGHGHA